MRLTADSKIDDIFALATDDDVVDLIALPAGPNECDRWQPPGPQR
jgi:hypothetical protein